ncbi:MAG: ABC transporter ATP-binding protein [Clostridiales bacterium]|nr:ABC transporter ATP-binding protein [Clostridiales bacterium]MBR5039732.1 ABC transporter ATP-binding protein [Clostridiales bacterium]MBR5418115.1 ABC transporter ATP-binding protein [Clostridiales bacterium]
MHTLEAKNLSKSFTLSERQRRAQDLPSRKKVAVDDISFTAHSGEVFGLLGPNGAGKTTTMRMLATLIKPDNGEVLYDGKNIKDEPIATKSNFAFLTTDLQLDKKSTANDMFDYFAGLYHVPKEKADERKKELFSTFGVDAFADTKISKLSQGMKQKVSLAISVIHDPDFIIFDEPTNGLDIIASRDVREFILRMKKEGKCMIISTHLFDLVEKICDRAAMIVNGKIVVNDTLENLMNGRSLEDSFYDIYTQYQNK